MADNSAYVKLLEYDNIEGLILSTEVTKKRVKSVKKYIDILVMVIRFMKVGKVEVMMVIRVDKDRRYIDLSKK